MRILYDGMIYAYQNAGGINRYFANLIGRLPDDAEPILALAEHSHLNFPSHPRLQTLRRQTHLRANSLAFRLKRFYHQSNVARSGADIAHPTYYLLTTERPIKDYRCPVVMTVYDMILEKYAAQLDPQGWQQDAKRKAILAAQTILCISESTKRDLLERIPVPEDRIHVTYLASDLDIRQSFGAESVPARPYFLYVGSRNSYKNFGGLLSAFATIASIRPDPALCVVGPPFTADEQAAIINYGLEDRIQHYGHVEDDHLAKLYRCSLAFVYPSFYEGFGIPPLEAMSCGTVVIASDNSSLPEVVGDAGILIDPHETDALSEALLTLYDYPALRDQYIEKGSQQAQKFQWEKTAHQTVAVYQTLSR